MPYKFTQPCPTCGRHVRIAIEYLGRSVACQHCQAEFFANGHDGEERPSSMAQPLMERVEAILSRTSPSMAYGETLDFPSTMDF